MEVVAAAPSAGPVPPYQRRDVQEWSHIDQITGMLEHARVEHDHWTATSHNATHQYGKVVDLRDRSGADGKIQQRQRKQLEVFRSKAPGGSLQVIRTHTVATSSSRWSSTAAPSHNSDFENLHLALNPLDLSSQKTKASVGRSGSIGGRRPPSRPRSIAKIDTEEDITSQLNRVSRLCQQIQDNSDVKQSINRPKNERSNIKSSKPNINDRRDGDGSVSDYFDIEENEKEYEKIINQNGVDSQTPSPVEYQNLVDEIKKSDEWKSKPTETGRRLNTALRGNNVDLEALDQILKSISPGSSGTYSDTEKPNSDEYVNNIEKKTPKAKRHSFITVESLKEVRGRLRRLSSPIDDFYGNIQHKDEELDDGIASEDNSIMKKDSTMPVSNVGVSRVRSYVYGMETMLGNNRKPVVGTGSLESRTSGKLNGSSINRSEDWYNRRKSYGFEQVHNQQIDQSNSISLHARNKIESSTDSGICRSTEIVLVPPSIKTTYNRDINKADLNNESDKQNLQIYNKNGNSTIINVNSENKTPINCYQTTHQTDYNTKKDSHNELINIWNRRASLTNNNEKRITNKDSEQITITIPIVSEDNLSTSNRKLYHRQLSENSSISIEQTTDTDLKRHSIAVDESKYVNRNDKYPFAQLRRTSLAVGEKTDSNEMVDEDNNLQRKTKKVEFCKTEVHFAAESGRVNIVETDEKPPPTNNFRRRRRNSGITNNQTSEDINKNGLPVIHFGDTNYEKQLFSVPDHENIQVDDVSSAFQRESPVDVVCNGTVTVSNVPIESVTQELAKDISENENQPRGILKNRMIKPRPYLLGDNDEIPTKDINEQEKSYTVKDELQTNWEVHNDHIDNWVALEDQQRNWKNSEEPDEGWNSQETHENAKPWFSHNEIETPKNWNIKHERDNSPSWMIRNDQDSKKIWGVQLRPVQKDESQMWRSTVTVQNTSYNMPSTSHVTENYTKDSNVDMKNYNHDPSHTEFQKMMNSLHPMKKSSESAFKSHLSKSELSANSITEFKPLISRSPEVTQYSGADIRRSSWSVADRIKQVENLRWGESKGYSTKVNFGSGEATVIENIDSNKKDNLTLWPQEEVHKSDFKPTKSVQSNAPKLDNNKVTNISFNRQPVVKQQTTAVSAKNNQRRLEKSSSLNSSRTDRRQMVPTNKSLETKNDNLSSPMLVGLQNTKSVRAPAEKIKQELFVDNKDKYNNSINKILVSSYVKNLPNTDKKNITNTKKNLYLQRSSSPKKDTRKIDSYYNAIRSPKLTKKYVEKPKEETFKENKPDLIQHYIDQREYVNLSTVFNDQKNELKNSINNNKSAEIKKVSPTNEDRPESPVYENIDEILPQEKESSIIQELTKAADQILQAVNGYTDEDSKFSSEDEDDPKNRYRRNSDVLETITESKSWKQSKEIKKQHEIPKNRNRSYRPTSSTSSLESVSKEYKPTIPVRPNRSEKLREERTKKKITSNNPEISKVTKARRLQRASSREALLQSHGSSSEDLSNSMEIRKPRMIRRNKTQSSTISDNKRTNSISQPNYTRRRETTYETRRNVDRVPVVGLQEIRHKTAVSTIRSTAEKAASREKNIKIKSEDLKKKNSTKSSFIRGNLGKSQGDAVSRRTCSRESGSTVSAIRTSSGVSSKKSA